jgi:ABC-type multidrug transport system ATPase subunit
MPLLCDNIAFTYPGAESRLFSDVSFRLTVPGFHAFFGPSGVGKTTLAKIICSEAAGFSGSVSTPGLTTLLYSYNLERLPGWSSVDRHLNRVIPPSMRSKKDELVEVFGLSDCIGSRFGRLSMGQQNRVNLIRYLLQNCDLLIMDESLANVDELTREKIILSIKETFAQRYFIYISHNVMEVARFCDDILVFGADNKRVHTSMVKGRNLKEGQSLSRAQLDETLLEIMNAA